jgi:hypothetical protein
VSSGLRATLPRVAEHATAHCGVVPGDGTSQAAGFTHAATRKPAVGLDSHRNRVVGAVTGLSHQRLDQEVDPPASSATASQRHRAGSATRCAVGSDGVQRREPSAIT